MDPFKYSVNTNQFRNRMTTAEIVDLCLAADVQGIEWGLRGLDTAKADVSEMKRRTLDAGLEVVGFINAGHLWLEDEMRQWSEALADCPGTTLRVTPPWFAWNYSESLHQKNGYLDLFKGTKAAMPMLESLSREYNIKYVLELHAGSVAASPWALRNLLEGIDPDCVGVIYDPANTLLEGFIRPRGACELLGKHLAYVHAKNLMFVPAPSLPQPQEPSRVQWQMHRTFLDQGMVDFMEVYFALKCVGYRGWVSLEEFVTEEPVQELTKSIQYLKQCAESAPAAPCEPFSSFPSP